MSSEPVSDKRLEELIANNRRAAEQWNQFDADQRSRNPEYDSFAEEEINAQYSALTELKSLRAQQAEPPAGCAEMAREIYKIVAEEFINSGLYQWQDDHLEAEIAAHLKATKTLPDIAAKLAPLFTLQSDMYSLLLECREYTMQRVTLRTLNHDKGKALLAKLYAALGKGDADGGREVVK
jgi:hypothetical protein